MIPKYAFQGYYVPFCVVRSLGFCSRVVMASGMVDPAGEKRPYKVALITGITGQARLSWILTLCLGWLLPC